MAKDEEELEFISVSPDDDGGENGNMSQSYGVSNATGRGGYDNVVGNWILNQSKHPAAIFFHLLFKGLAIFMYMFGSWITTNFIFNFVVCIVLIAFDFWTVKNISGRLLVGLRWWSYVREDGSNEWIFESLEDMAEITGFDSRIFWGALYITPCIWSVQLLIGLFGKLKYLPIVIAAIAMSGANIIGYMKCSTSAKKKIHSMVENGMKQSSISVLENSSVRNWIFNSLLAVTTSNLNSNEQAERRV